MTSLVVIGHRGASAYAPEHSFAAWDLALALGADYLEQDLQLTRDGVLVVLHDETLDRTVRKDGRGCSGRVSDWTMAQLSGCEVGSWFNQAYPALARPEYAAEPLPTLGAVLGRYADRASFYIETKHPEAAPGMEQLLVGMLHRFDLVEASRHEWRVLVQSFSEASLRKVRAIEPALPLIQLVDEEETVSETIRRLGRCSEYAVGIAPHYARTTPELIAAAHEHCLVVHPYTVNQPADQATLVEAGVDGMFTDLPDLLVRTRPAGEPRGRAACAAAAAAHARCRDRLKR